VSAEIDDPAEMPLPSSPQTFFLGGLFALGALAAIYVASSIILPVVLAFVLKLILQPAVGVLERMRVPRAGRSCRSCWLSEGLWVWWRPYRGPPRLGIHLVEGQTLTPLLLARRSTLNPVLVILSLVFWFWMWGVLGAILAVPMLAIMKIMCDRLRPLKALGHFLEG